MPSFRRSMSRSATARSARAGRGGATSPASDERGKLFGEALRDSRVHEVDPGRHQPAASGERAGLVAAPGRDEQLCVREPGARVERALLEQGLELGERRGAVVRAEEGDGARETALRRAEAG